MSPSLTDRNCWIFDMDGTLTINAHGFDAIKRELDIPADQLIIEALAALPPDIAARRYARLKELELEVAHQSIAQPGAGELLEALRSRDYPIGILTRNSRSTADATLAACGLAEFFKPEFILSRDCCAPKPSPDGILNLLSQWGMDAGRSVMTGDYRLDLEAGRNAGSLTVYIDPKGEFVWQDQADLCIQELTELISIL